MPRTLDTRKGRAKRTFRKANMVSIEFVYVYWEVVGGMSRYRTDVPIYIAIRSVLTKEG
jgi:hypothetical protein